MTARTQRPPARLTPRLLWMLWLVWVSMTTGHPAATASPKTLPGIAPAPICGADPPRHDPMPRGFLGYACRDARCTSHKAGFDWAERNGIADGRSCVTRNDVAFAEGCRAYADEAVTAEQAGFRWARENDLGDSCLCAGGGAAFEAGCEAYVRGFAD
jgi:hypothetical protein